MYLLNGEPGGCIDIADRGFQYGDGLFETLEVVDGNPLFLQEHLSRLEKGCKKLLIPPPDLHLLAEEARKCASAAAHAVLKLIVTRGCGGRGYRQPPVISPTRLFTLHPYPDYPAEFQSRGVALRICRHRLAGNPALAGIKHLNRLEQILARAEWRDDDIQEGLMLDQHGFVVEGTMSNLFLVKDGVLYTPDLSQCGVAGIVREIVVRLALQNQIPLLVMAVDRHALFQADELFVCNSVIGIWPVRQLEQQQWRAGEVTQTLQKLFGELRGQGR
ncbi:MAG: aminodeoxychorismate lyase [Methylococcales bacterium]|nr:aminodeoxychorismate lyase [Methylococcales bacterium]